MQMKKHVTASPGITRPWPKSSSSKYAVHAKLDTICFLARYEHGCPILQGSLQIGLCKWSEGYRPGEWHGTTD